MIGVPTSEWGRVMQGWCVRSSFSRVVAIAAITGLAGLPVAATAQLRLCTWNVTDYAVSGSPPTSPRDPVFQTAFYGIIPPGMTLSGQSMSPDIVVAQEMLTAAGVTRFTQMLNTAPGSPGDWAAAPFLDGPDTESAFFYRTSKVQHLATWTIALGSSSTCNQPRHTRRYDFRPVGYTAPAASVGVYSIHLKAQGSNTACPAGENAEGRRLVECQRIRDNAAGVDTNPNWVPGLGGTNPFGSSALPAGYQAMVAGDTNIQNSARVDYQTLVGLAPSPAGRFFDPIATPGNWNNNSAFRVVHTQDPLTQMDDRLDQVLVGSGLLDRDGLDYIFVPDALGLPQPHSLATWYDTRHTYRAWGNDGTTYNEPLRTGGNTMVGAVIAQALVTSAGSGGHLPIIADFRVPAKAAAPASIAFGQTQTGALAVQTLSVSHAGDVAKWTVNGLDALRYTMSTTGPFTIAPGPFSIAPGAAPGAHVVAMSTSSPGVKTGTLTITSNDPDAPTIVVALSGEVTQRPPCTADFNLDGNLDPDDLADYIACYFASPSPCEAADFNADTNIDPDDLSDYIAAYFAGC